MDELDAVSVIVPNKFHAPLVIQVLESGKHAFCEKPPAINADQVADMKAAAEKAAADAEAAAEKVAADAKAAVKEAVKEVVPAAPAAPAIPTPAQ